MSGSFHRSDGSFHRSVDGGFRRSVDGTFHRYTPPVENSFVEIVEAPTEVVEALMEETSSA